MTGGQEVDWHPPEDAHLCVYVCGTCGQGFMREGDVQCHQVADGHDGEPYWVARVYLGTTLRWRPDTTEGFRCEVRALGHDGTTPWLGLVGGGVPGTTHYWWVNFDTYVDACFPADPWTVETPDAA